MAVHNGEEHLRPAIQSLLRQTLTEFELIIINDGSTDNSLSILGELQKVDPRIRVIQNEHNIGLAASLNRGLAAASTEIIARADADDVYHPDRLERQFAFMTKEPHLTVVGTAVSFINAAGDPLNTKIDSTFPVSDSSVRLHSLLGCCLWHTTVMFRKAAIQAAGGYSPEFRGGPEDYDLWAKLLPDHQLVNLPDVLAQVRLHTASVTANWSRGFEMFSSVSQRLIERYLGEPVTPQATQALVAMCSYGGDLTTMDYVQGLSLLRKVLTTASSREKPSVYAKFRRKCSSSLIEKASAFVYRDRTATLALHRAAIKSDPAQLLCSRLWGNLIRCLCPELLRRLVKSRRTLP
jgi:hypothetical protein